MIVYFDTVRRKRPVRNGGELVKLDWTAKRVLRTIPLFPSDPDIEDDPNPRGNSRGGKGILVRGGEVVVGTYHTLMVYDLDLDLKRRIRNNLFANIHEICSAGENTWVASTALDCALLVDPAGRTLKTWWPREEPLLRERFGLEPMTIDKTADNRLSRLHDELSLKPSHTHLNAVCRDGERTFVLLNRLGVLVQIEPELRLVLEDKLLRGSHSPVIAGDGRRVIVCSSFFQELLFYDLESGALVKRLHLLDFPDVAQLREESPDQPFNKAIFVRGLEILDEGRLLVGISPASILEVDTVRDRLLGIFCYSRDVGDAVHGLAMSFGEQT
jgi:hypothetical protein